MSMAVKITLDNVTLSRIADLFKRAGDAAQAVRDAADRLTVPDAEAKCARRALRSASAAAWASILAQLFGR
jgi:hypothetical protein